MKQFGNHFNLNKILIPQRSIGNLLPDLLTSFDKTEYSAEIEKEITFISDNIAIVGDKNHIESQTNALIIVFHGGPSTS